LGPLYSRVNGWGAETTMLGPLGVVGGMVKVGMDPIDGAEDGTVEKGVVAEAGGR